MTLEEIMKMLSTEGIETSIRWDSENSKIYLDLNTGAKSHVHLYGDGVVHGRYKYINYIDLSLEPADLIRFLCFEFVDSLYGRDYYNSYWAELCKRNEIKIS